jgi:predicted AlkP superfamily phosphohydrolase/phosphomutase
MKKPILAVAMVLLLSCGILAFYQFRNASSDTDGPIYLIGLDGASWNLMNPLMEKGKLPNLRKLKEKGVSGELQSAFPAHSAFLWTTIATGKTKEKHGIGDFTVKVEDAEQPSTGNLRRVKAFWNMLSERNIPVSVVNWWVTWPPEKVKGVMVSDKYRLGKHRQLDMQVTFPAELQNKMPYPEINKARAHKEWKQYHLPELYDVTNDGRITAFDKALKAYPTYWCQDASVWEASKYVVKNHPAKVFAVVFRIVDISSHFMWCYLPLDKLDYARNKSKEGTLTASDIEALDREFAKIIEPVYTYADTIVGDIMESAPENSTFIIVSDHGFGFHRTSYTHTTQKVPPAGIVILSGGPYKKGAEIQNATIYDITPTLLYQLRLPVAKDFDGKPLVPAFQQQYRADHQVAVIPSWETGPAKTGEKPIPSETDPETLEDLRALGYIQD